MYFLIGVGSLILFVIFCYFFVKKKINAFTMKYLGTTDIMPFEGIDISYKDYQMDFIPNGIQLFRRGKGEFKVDASSYSSTTITIL